MDRLALLVKKEIDRQREAQAREDPSRVVFGVAGLYGIAPSTALRLSPTESVDSGPFSLKLEAHSGANVGVIDFEQTVHTGGKQA